MGPLSSMKSQKVSRLMRSTVTSCEQLQRAFMKSFNLDHLEITLQSSLSFVNYLAAHLEKSFLREPNIL